MRGITYQERLRIEQSALFIAILPYGGLEGTEMEGHMEYAMQLGKRIMLWRPIGREDEPIPRALARYQDYIVIDGDVEAAAHAVRQERVENDRPE